MILHIAVPAPLPQLFEYLLPPDCTQDQFPMGIRVRVPFGRREAIGFLLKSSDNSQFDKNKLKPALEIIDQTPILPPHLIDLARWASDYYHHPIGEVLASALPVLLRQGKPAELRRSFNESVMPAPTDIQIFPNPEQQQAIDAITNTLGQFQCFLLHGVTGSGKTEVYLRVIEQVLQRDLQALVLIPEISLTPQTVARFQQRFAVPIAVLHSNLTDRERLDAWILAKAGTAKIVIGTRSAIFTPLAKSGVIIIDEEHDLSFKQQEGFRYSARDLALVRARLEKIPIVLGTATPSLETFYNAQQKRYQLLTLPRRVGEVQLPKMHLIDVRNQKLTGGLSKNLLTAIQHHLDNNGQVLLFLNRRGFAPILICNACGWIASCARCDAKLIYHHRPPVLQCHHCGSTRPIDRDCPSCASTHLYPLGIGTQQLEQLLNQHFPQAGIVRIDRDSTRRKGALQTILDTVHNKQNRILVGTQMIAKGHHFPAVTLVAILDADGGLFSADFRASERTAQLLLQVAGRAGRANQAGEVLIQTYNPQHVLLQHLLAHDYEKFAETLLNERQIAALPPYTYLALLRAEAKSQQYSLQFLQQVHQLAKNININNIDLFEPVPSLMERKAGFHRAQLLLQAKQRNHLHQLLKQLTPQITALPLARRVRWSLDIDPMEVI